MCPAQLCQQQSGATFPNCSPEARHGSPPPVFDLDGCLEREVERHSEPSRDISTAQISGAVERLLLPAGDDVPICSAARIALRASHGSLLTAASVLQRMGWVVKVCASRGGSLRQLRHTYLTAARPSGRGEPAEWVIDPAFSQAFQVARPTPRYARILSAAPALVVAPLGRLLRATLLLGDELERCFEEQGMPLPPWRSADALASRYSCATATAPPPGAPAATTAAAVAAAAAAAEAEVARKRKRALQQLERLHLRLLQLGVQPAGDWPTSLEPASSAFINGPASPVSVIDVRAIQ